MKTGNVIWGMILVFVGGILLLDNFNVIDFHWGAVWQLWPLILIVSGINMISAGSNRGTGMAVSVVLTLIVLGLIAYQGTHPGDIYRSHSFFWQRNNPDNEFDPGSPGSENSVFTEPYEGTARAVLNISGGATVYRLDDTTANLFTANVDQQWGRYSLQKISRDTVEVLNFNMEHTRKQWNFNNNDHGNLAIIRLNAQPVWDINLETGAGETDFDLTPFKIRNLHLKGGAASFDIKLGEPANVTHVTAETGAAEVTIHVPADAGCLINSDSGLSSKDFDGFTQQANGTYQTPNYLQAKKKIILKLNGGLSNFEVNRY